MNIMSHININKIIRIDINKETDIHNFCIYLKNPIASNIITASKFRIKKALAFRRLHLINYPIGVLFLDPTGEERISGSARRAIRIQT